MAFGVDGWVVTPLGAHDAAEDCGLQADQKIVCAGWAFPSEGRFAVARYNTDGTLDSSFNGTGTVLTSVVSNNRDQGYGMVIQADGKIVVVGRSQSLGGFSKSSVGVVRYNANGSLDKSFHKDGKLTVDQESRPTTSWGHDVALQSDGKIVIATQPFGLVRLNANGSLDGTFGGGDGKVRTTVSGDSLAVAKDVIIQPDGKIVATGYGTAGNLVVVRYNANGTLDGSFGSGGIAEIDKSFLGYDTKPQAVRLQNDGSIVVVGLGPFESTSFVARLTPGGALDTTFNGTGHRRFKYESEVYGGGAYGVAIQPDGQIVVAGGANALSEGSFNTRMAVARFNTDGSFDTTFGGGDGTQIQLGVGIDQSNAYNVVIQPDGKIITNGQIDAHFGLARINSDGSQDTAAESAEGEAASLAAAAADPFGDHAFVRSLRRRFGSRRR
jgi:uncharacterized delta-60 repeat protein